MKFPLTRDILVIVISLLASSALQAGLEIQEMIMTGKTVRIAPKREVEFAVGDTLTFYNPDAYYVGEARVVDIGSASPASDRDLDVIKTKTWHLVTPLFKTVADIKLDAEVAVSPGGRVVSRDRCGNGFVIRDTTVRDHRARGILVKASNGIIENNTVDNSSIAGIVLAPEFSWMEADYSSDVKIIGNTIRHTGSDAANSFRSQAGAISIVAEGLDGKFAPVEGHKNIQISDNIVEACRGAGVVVTSAQNIQVTGNRFERIETGHFGSEHGIADNAVFWIDKVDGIAIENNSTPKDSKIVIGSAVTRQQVQNHDSNSK